MGFVVDMATCTTDLVILDATNFTATPQALGTISQRVPPGFHGSWVGPKRPQLANSTDRRRLIEMDHQIPSIDTIAKTLQLSATRMRAFAVGAMACGAMACGATAIGALAVGTLAVGRLTVRQSEFAKVEIGDFVVRCLTAMELGPDSANAALAAHVAPTAAANASTRH